MIFAKRQPQVLVASCSEPDKGWTVQDVPVKVDFTQEVELKGDSF
jgi:hypothetical protein